MSEPRLIDANEIVEVAERAWNAWNLAMATQDTNQGINKVLKRQELCKAVKAVAEGAPTIDPENLPIVRQLREELERVTKERDKAQRHEHLDELKLCLESSRDINLVYIPRSLAEKVATESMNLESELAKVTAEREALAANSRPAAYGEWEEIRDPYGKIEGWICKCGSESRIKSDFCPYCGADMRGKKEENQC